MKVHCMEHIVKKCSVNTNTILHEHVTIKAGLTIPIALQQRHGSLSCKGIHSTFNMGVRWRYKCAIYITLKTRWLVIKDTLSDSCFQTNKHSKTFFPNLKKENKKCRTIIISLHTYVIQLAKLSQNTNQLVLSLRYFHHQMFSILN